MSFLVAGAIAGGGALIGGLGGAYLSSKGAQSAAQTQSDAAQKALDAQKAMYDQSRADQEPWRTAGAGALSQLSQMTGQGAPQFTESDFLSNKDPGYAFNLQQGQQALERSAAARGGLMSGGMLKDLSAYSQGQASNEYQNAYNRFMNSQNTQFNRLSSIAGMGQNATGQMAQLGMHNADAIGGIATGLGNAQGASQIAQGNAWGGALSGIGSGVGGSVSQGMMLNGMMPKSPVGGGYGMPAMGSADNLQMPQFGSSLASNGPSLSMLGG